MLLRKRSLQTWTAGPANLVQEALKRAGARYHDNLTLRDDSWDASGNYRFGITVVHTKVISNDERGPRGGARYEPAPGVSMNSPSPWRSEHPIHAACWHAFRDFFGELFTIEPNAIVVTREAVYRGFNGFMDDFPATGRRNVGSKMYPIEFQQRCYCGDYYAAYGDTPEWIVRAWEYHRGQIPSSMAREAGANL